MTYKISAKTYRALVGPLVLVLCWFLVGATHGANPILLPNVGSVVRKIGDFLITGTIWPNLGATLSRTVVGFALSVGLGVPIGVYLGAHPKIYQMCEGVIDFFRSLPATAMFPLFLMAFGIGNGSKIAIAWFISFWIILVNAAYGVLHGSKTRVRVAESLRMTRWQLLSRVLFMDALPQIFIGLHIGLSLSLIAVVVSEMFIGSNTGLGQRIYDAYLTYESSSLYAWLVITGVIGYLLNQLFTRGERRVIHWVGK